MATLGKIRNHGVLLMIIIGAALLIFIVTGFQDSILNLFGKSKTRIGSINGEKIEYKDFSATIDQMRDFYKIEYGQSALTDEISEQLRQEAWNQTVMRKVVDADAGNIGMTVSKSELTDLTVGNNISPMITGRRVFMSQETGQFDKNQVIGFLNNLDNPEFARNYGAEQTNSFKNYWKFIESNVKYNSLFEKYNTLLSKSLVTNSKEAKYAYDNSKNSVNVVYAMKPYFTIPDSTINIADSDLKSLYNKKKEQFKQTESCDISYVVFHIVPSDKDIAMVDSLIQKAKIEFVAAQDSALMDVTNFNSDVPYRNIFLAKSDVEDNLKEFAFSSKKGAMYGPVFANDKFTMAKIAETTFLPDSVRLSAIAIQEQTLEASKAKADSIMRVLKLKTMPFAQAAQQFSLDKNSAAHGGDMGWYRQATLTPSLAEKAFSMNVNEPFIIDEGEVTSIFIVTEKTKPVPKVKLAVIERTVAPSSTTQSKIFQDSKQFAGSIKDYSEFQKVAQEKNYQVISATNIDRNAPRLSNLANTRSVIRWAFDSKVNATSDVFECNDNLIVASVTRKNADGYKTLEEVKPQLLAELRKDKKFDQMKSLFDNKTIEQLKAENLTVDTVKNLSFASASAGSLGNDPAMIANAPFAEINKISSPMKGLMGVFVFNVLSKTENPNPFNVNQEKAMLNMQNQNVFYYIIETLKKVYKVKDERYRFF